MTWGEIKLSALKKMFAKDEVIKVVDLDRLSSDDDTKVYLNGMVEAGNEAINRILPYYQNNFEYSKAEKKYVVVEKYKLTESTAKYATLRVLKPDNTKFISEKFEIIDKQIIFSITDDFSDQVEEIGIYKLQISLYDTKQGKVTIPPIEFTVLEPIFDDEEKVATVSCRKVVDE